MIKYVTSFALLLYSIAVFSQKHQTDSLSKVLANNPADSLTNAIYNFQSGLLAYTSSAYDSALYFLQRSEASAKRLKNDTLQIKVLNLLGDVYSDKGDNPKALKLYQEAVYLADKTGSKEMQARIIKNIGVLYVSWQKLPEALKHYDSALRMAQEIKNLGLEADCKNNMGVVYEIGEDYPKAISLYNEALEFYTRINKKESMAMVLSNLAIAYKYSGQLSKSIEYNKKALALAEEMQDKWKQAATMNNIGSAYLKMGEAELSYGFALKSVVLSEEIGAREVALNAYETLSESAFALGRYKEATEHLRRMVQVKDSFINLESTKQVAELQTKFETAKKEQLIQQQQFYLQRKNYQLGAIVLGVGFLGLMVYSYYRRQKFKRDKEAKEQLLRQQEEATKAVLNAEESERRRIAVELHDGVGQVMSAARMNLEAVMRELLPLPDDKLIKLERVVSLVDEGCKEVRAVSHSMMPNALLKKGLSSALYDFIQKIDQQVIKCHLHIEGLDERLQPEIESVVYRIIQECVNNVIKHSVANQLDLSIFHDGDNLDLTIEDNGKGFSQTEGENGIGLQNIRARVQYLKGSLELDSAPGKGTFIGIHIPLNQTS
jgi:signal transduction histidine kinase